MGNPEVRLLELLARARDLGFLGPGDVEPQLERSLAFAAVAGPPRTLGIDLGTGGGLPGLVLAHLWRGTRWVFVEVNHRRARWLERAAISLELTNVDVLIERAEVAGRGRYRGAADLVTSRSFGPPAVTAECGAPLLRTGGRLVVAGPPEAANSNDRWPEEPLKRLNLQVVGHRYVSTSAGPSSFTVLQSAGLCDIRFPRRTGAPAKAPLF